MEKRKARRTTALSSTRRIFITIPPSRVLLSQLTESGGFCNTANYVPLARTRGNQEAHAPRCFATLTDEWGTRVRNQVANSRMGRLTKCRLARRYPMRLGLLPCRGTSLQPAEWEEAMAGITVTPKPARTNWKMLASWSVSNTERSPAFARVQVISTSSRRQ